MMKIWLMVPVLCLFAGAALAEPIDGKTARKMLFSPKGADVTMRDDAGLSAQHLAVLETVVKAQAEAAGYYGVAVVSPDEDLLKSEATQLVANHHSIEAAADAALKICNEMRKGKAECVVAAEIRPKKWTEQPLSLSREATEAFRKDYRKGRGAKAMAISAQTGKYAIFKGDGASFAAKLKCNDLAGPAGATDCETVIAD